MSIADAARLKAGLAVDEAMARAWAEPGGTHWPWLEMRVLREVSAKRAILALHEEFLAKRDQSSPHPQYAVEMGIEVLGQVVAALASVYTETDAVGGLTHGD